MPIMQRSYRDGTKSQWVALRYLARAYQRIAVVAVEATRGLFYIVCCVLFPCAFEVGVSLQLTRWSWKANMRPSWQRGIQSFVMLHNSRFPSARSTSRPQPWNDDVQMASDWEGAMSSCSTEGPPLALGSHVVTASAPTGLVLDGCSRYC